MFFTFWGLNSLRKQDPPKRERKAMDKMFGAMMPTGADALKLSQMHMLGAGTSMIKQVMKKNNVAPLRDLMTSPMEGLDDTGVAHFIKARQVAMQDSNSSLF
jgi:peroxiredoxin family protein